MLHFAHPLFLAGLAALAVPVLLHLLSRRAAARFSFPSVRFIDPLPLPRQGRRRLQDLPLLFLRLAILAAAVLALAGPQWAPRRPAGAGQERPDEVVVVADLSSSMGGWGSTQRLRRVLPETAARYPGARLGLVTVSNRVLQVLPLSTPRAAFAQAARELTPEPVSGAPAAGLREALRLFSGSGRRLLCVVSDFQLSDWQGADLPAVPPGIAVQCLNTAPVRTGNLAVAAARIVHLPGDDLRVVVTVRSFTDAARTVDVHLRCGLQALKKALDLPAHGVRDVAFQLRKPGLIQADIFLDQDVYAADDSYFVWLGKPLAVPLLAVVPAGVEREKQQEFFFLRKALESAALDGMPPYRLDSVEPDFVSALDPQAFPVVFLLGAGAYLQPADLTRLRRHVEAGGWLVCTPGVRALEQLRALDAAGLGAAAFRGLAHARAEGRRAPWSLGWIDPDGPLAALAEDAAGTELFTFGILRYLRLAPAPDARVLLRTTDEHPLLLARRVGRGQVLLSAVAFEPAWTDLPMTTAFVPLLQELVRQAAPAGAGAMPLECGEAFPRVAAAAVTPEAGGHERNATTGENLAPGVVVHHGIPFEINVSRRESTPEHMDAARVRARLTGATLAAPDTAAVAAAASPGTALAPFLAVAAAVLVLAELLATLWLDARRGVTGEAPGAPAGAGGDA